MLIKLWLKRGRGHQLIQEAEGYKAKVVNESEGEAARFVSVYEEYIKAKDVTRKRIHLENGVNTKEVDKVILDQNVGGDQGSTLSPLKSIKSRRKQLMILEYFLYFAVEFSLLIHRFLWSMKGRKLLFLTVRYVM